MRDSRLVLVMVVSASLFALAASGCTRAAGDSLVVVTVDATSPLDGVALLHVTSTAGGKTSERDIGPEAGMTTFSIPPGKTFRVQVAPPLTGTLAGRVEARAPRGAAP